MGDLLKRECPTPLLGGINQIKIVLGGYAAALKPRSSSRVRDPKIIREVGDGRPDESNLFHADNATQIAYRRQYAKCEVRSSAEWARFALHGGKT